MLLLQVAKLAYSELLHSMGQNDRFQKLTSLIKVSLLGKPGVGSLQNSGCFEKLKEATFPSESGLAFYVEKYKDL